MMLSSFATWVRTMLFQTMLKSLGLISPSATDQIYDELIIKMKRILKSNSTNNNSYPLLKLQSTNNQYTWLVTEFEEKNGTIRALTNFDCDFPQIKDTPISFLKKLGNEDGFALRIDESFRAKYPISTYSIVASAMHNMVFEDRDLVAVKMIEDDTIRASQPKLTI